MDYFDEALATQFNNNPVSILPKDNGNKVLIFLDQLSPKQLRKQTQAFDKRPKMLRKVW